MNTFSEELVKHRLEKGISLSDISAQTKINIKYLEAIDQELFDVLPQTYIRAFLKQYAEFIGLDSNEILKKYDLMVSNNSSDGNISQVVGTSFSENSNDVLEKIESEKNQPDFDPVKAENQQKQRMVIIVSILGVAIILVLVYIFNFVFQFGDGEKVEEKSFRDVISSEIPKVEKKENLVEEKNISPTIIKVDTIVTSIAPKIIAISDSLILTTIVNGADTVWLNVKSDETRARNAYLVPGERRDWHAKDKFLITCGNAGAITIELNGKSLGPLGNRGAIIKNFEVSGKDLDLE